MSFYKILSLPPCHYCEKPSPFDYVELHPVEKAVHTMHTDCLLQWVQKSQTEKAAISCPMCREEIDLCAIKNSVEKMFFKKLLDAYQFRLNTDDAPSDSHDEEGRFLDDLFGTPFLPDPVQPNNALGVSATFLLQVNHQRGAMPPSTLREMDFRDPLPSQYDLFSDICVDWM